MSKPIETEDSGRMFYCEEAAKALSEQQKTRKQLQSILDISSYFKSKKEKQNEKRETEEEY